MTSNNFESNINATGAVFNKVHLTRGIVRGSTFSECKFIKCDVSETQFQNCRFIECDFDECTMKLTRVEDTTFARVKFMKCNLLGINWTEANWSEWATKIDSIEFYSCFLEYSVFLGLELKKIKMKDCNARDVNFAETDLSEADFAGTDFAGATFLRTNLSKANFVGAKNYALNLADNKSRGAKFSLPEAVRLLYYMDIVIIDPVTNEEIAEEDLGKLL